MSAMSLFIELLPLLGGDRRNEAFDWRMHTDPDDVGQVLLLE
jgi:hypothetical protein